MTLKDIIRASKFLEKPDRQALYAALDQTGNRPTKKVPDDRDAAIAWCALVDCLDPSQARKKREALGGGPTDSELRIAAWVAWFGFYVVQLQFQNDELDLRSMAELLARRDDVDADRLTGGPDDE